MGEAPDATLSEAMRAELTASSDAVKCADAGDLSAARAGLELASSYAKGTHRDVGYRLRLASLEAGAPVVRLSEK
jgi:hypothetical protein